ncbi:hypothetical protein C0U40_13380 [Amylibacter cionae]|nr:hypothetical protein C0U40_13380 [Amylibacter cionae]
MPAASRHTQIERAAQAVVNFCQPLSNFLNRGAQGQGAPMPVLDMTVLALDAFSDVKEASGKQPDWRVVSGRVTRQESAESLYHKGIWLESEDGYILDFNRPGLCDGIRVTRNNGGALAEYRAEKPLKAPKTSSLLPVWRGEASGFEGFASQQQMRSSYLAMIQGVTAIMTTPLAHLHF